MRKGKAEYPQLIRTKIEDIIRSHSSAVWIAIRQRARFEAWLKIELAAALEENPRVECQLEAPFGDGRRCDLLVDHDFTKLYIELKAICSNWSVPGVEKKSAALTQSIAGFIADVERLRCAKGHGICIAAFVEFPIPEEDERWMRQLKYISAMTGVPFWEDDCHSLIPIDLGDERKCNVLVCACQV
jgi:hypothetical protein